MSQMIEPVQIPIRAQTCWISPKRCMFWEEKSTLVVGGFQLGRFPEVNEKSARFSSLDLLQEQLLFFKAERILIIGGFPLPENNQYLEEFIEWRKRFPSIKMDCVLARSSPVAESLLYSLGVHIHPGMLLEEPFVWIASRIASEKWLEKNDPAYSISGYEDPGYTRYGAPRQTPGTPAFYFSPFHAKLPAFSRPKGELPVKPGKDEMIWLTHSKHLERKY